MTATITIAITLIADNTGLLKGLCAEGGEGGGLELRAFIAPIIRAR